MVIKKMLKEIRKLSKSDRYRLRLLIEADIVSEEDIETSKRSAGGWFDIDAEKMFHDSYRNRRR